MKIVINRRGGFLVLSMTKTKFTHYELLRFHIKVRLLSLIVFDCLVANNYDPPKAWNDRIDAGPPFIRSACPPPRPSLPPGADLPRKQWVRLNRLRSGTARVGETLQLWGMQEAASCPCGHPTQTVEHVVTDCVLLKSPGDLTALRCPNAETRSWLSELPIEL